MEYSEKQLQRMKNAEKLFAEKGYNGTSVRDIAEKAGINLAMVSYYFGSKEKLLEAVFDYRIGMTKQLLSDILHKTNLSSLEKMNLLIDVYVKKIIEQQPFNKILAREQVVNTTGHTANLILQMKRTYMDTVLSLIREGQKKGEFQKHIDVSLLMTTIIGTANHLVTTKHYYRQLNNYEELSDEAFNKLIEKKLRNHIKFILKASLTYES